MQNSLVTKSDFAILLKQEVAIENVRYKDLAGFTMQGDCFDLWQYKVIDMPLIEALGNKEIAFEELSFYSNECKNQTHANWKLMTNMNENDSMYYNSTFGMLNVLKLEGSNSTAMEQVVTHKGNCICYFSCYPVGVVFLIADQVDSAIYVVHKKG